MVCQQMAGINHDFSRDPIELVEEDGWLHAVGTTLGADDGAGVALCMAVLEDEYLSHPVLEVILTVDEEIGLVGAREMDCSAIASRRMLNLDLTVADEFVVGCCSGSTAAVALPITREPCGGMLAELKLDGLTGGHAGIDIALDRQNAAILMARAIERIRQTLCENDTDSLSCPLRLVSLASGEKRNAIPREAVAEVLLPMTPLQDEGFLSGTMGSWACRTRLEEAFSQARELVAESCGGVDTGVAFELSWLGKKSVDALSMTDTTKVLELLSDLPQGVLRMSDEFPNAVETSDNVGIVRLEDERLAATVSCRTNVARGDEPLVERIARSCGHVGASLTIERGGAPWQADMTSPFIARAKEVYEDLFGGEPKITITHGGLECGIFSRKLPGLEVFSLGPDVEDAHTPLEKLELSSYERLALLVTHLIADCQH